LTPFCQPNKAVFLRQRQRLMKEMTRLGIQPYMRMNQTLEIGRLPKLKGILCSLRQFQRMGAIG
jgi:hypothetical protein